MGFLERLFEKVTEREKLVLEAARVGDANEVIRLGILAAQLGLTKDDLPRVARVYLALLGVENPVEIQAILGNVGRAIVIANEED